MKQTSAERPLPVVMSKGAKEWFLTVNVNVTETGDGYEYESYSDVLDHRPTEDDVRRTAMDGIDRQTDEKILSGFRWTPPVPGADPIPVWLSDENQRNFSEAQRVAMMTSGQSLPVTFKLGEDEDRRPVYYEFTTVEELTGFYLAAVAYIQQCLTEGWAEKDSIMQQMEGLSS